MTAFKKLTPEEKLLHVIENPEQINKMGAGRKDKRKIPRFPDFAAGMDIKKIGLRGVNKGLLWLSAVLTITLVGFFIRDGKLMGRRFDELKNKIISKSPFHIKEMQSEIPDISSYVVEMEAKNPFHVGEYTGIKETDAKAPKIVEEAMMLKLVGILWSDATPQAIIEDETSTKTFLISKGSDISGLKVSEITPSEVILVTKDGEKKTLR